jgi:AcrR family transcriptional regulator
MDMTGGHVTQQAGNDPSGPGPDRRARKRDPEGAKAAILQAALEEFSQHGHSGARVDRIARNAGVSKPLIYDYFGDKDAIYAAALREAYVQIRGAEADLNLDSLPVDDAIRELVRFTMGHFWEKPWFITMLNTENLRGGDTVRALHDAQEIQSVLVQKLDRILRRGAEQGAFRTGVDPVDFYIYVASLCYFPVSNRFTLEAVFNVAVDDAWLARRCEGAADMLIAYLRPGGASDA